MGQNNIKKYVEQKMKYIPTGYSTLDSVIRGFWKSSLNVVASRPSLGKSAFIESIVSQIIESGQEVPIGYFSIETNPYLLCRRLISNSTGIPLSDVIHKMDEDEQVQKQIEKLSQYPLYIDDTAELDIESLEKKIGELVIEKQVKLIFIDYLQLITARRLYPTNREQEMGYVTRQLKALARRYEIPIVVLSQLNRRNESPTKVPFLMDLRDSGVIEDVADLIMFVHRFEYYGINCHEDGTSSQGIADIYIAKNRHGVITDFRLKFEKDCCRFRDLLNSDKPYEDYTSGFSAKSKGEFDLSPEFGNPPF